MKNCVVRTYRNGYFIVMENLTEKLDSGWNVKMCTSLQDERGTVDALEYILEKEE